MKQKNTKGARWVREELARARTVARKSVEAQERLATEKEKLELEIQKLVQEKEELQREKEAITEQLVLKCQHHLEEVARIERKDRLIRGLEHEIRCLRAGIAVVSKTPSLLDDAGIDEAHEIGEPSNVTPSMVDESLCGGIPPAAFTQAYGELPAGPFWERVKNVEPAGEEEVYAVELEPHSSSPKDLSCALTVDAVKLEELAMELTDE
jgi:hypothetical protein